MERLAVFFRLLFGLRTYDFRAARNWIRTMYPDRRGLVRLGRFTIWALDIILFRIYYTRR